jgi:hypothetical protein
MASFFSDNCWYNSDSIIRGSSCKSIVSCFYYNTSVLSGLPIAFPLLAFEIIVFLISFGLLFTGIGRITQVLVYPILTTTIMLSVAFLILGIECIMAGATGQRTMNLEDMKRSLK